MEDSTAKLMDHNDLHVLDLSPSLKTLAIMAIMEKNLSTEVGSCSNCYPVGITYALPAFKTAVSALPVDFTAIQW